LSACSAFDEAKKKHSSMLLFAYNHNIPPFCNVKEEAYKLQKNFFSIYNIFLISF